MRTTCRAASALAVSVVMLFAMPVPAVAGTAYSSYSNFTCGSYGYRNRATVQTSSSGARANTYVGAYPTASRGAGWFGVLERLYDDAGNLEIQDGYYYNEVTCQGFSSWTWYYTVHDNYYSRGISKSWTGSAYHGHTTFSSPMQTY